MKNFILLCVSMMLCTASIAQTKYTIPVVVHVISPTGSTLLTDEQVKDGIKNLNLQFQGLYGKMIKDKVITPHRNSMVALDNIQFKLATKDTNNNATTGIIKTQNSTWSNDAKAQHVTFKRKLQWNRARYMNIYIVAQLNTGEQSGMAYYPSQTATAANAHLDGVLIDDNIWINTLPLKSPRWTAGYEGTLVHEVGHYLNLIHTMGEVDGSGVADCNDPIIAAGDGIDDTPKHHEDMFKYDQNASESTRTVSNCDNQVIMIDNFMCYSKTQRFFTAGQIQRMKNALNSSVAGRNNLWTAANLVLTGLANDTVAPSVPASLTASNITTNSLKLTWRKATDNQQVLGYDIYKDSVFVACTIDTTWQINGLTTTPTQFTVKARDFDGNLSAASSIVNFPAIAAKTYCTAAGKTATDTKEWIKNVTLNTINNNSTGNNYYQDFSAVSTTLKKGTSHNLTVTLNDIWNANNDHDYIVAWIDWNNDSTFAANERYTSNKFVGATKKDTVNITIPDSATIGKIRMRVRSVWNGTNTLTSAAACGSDTYGEVEDYSIEVAPATPTTATYCTTSGNPTGNVIEFVKNVKLNTINNTSTKKTVFYEDFTTISTTVQKKQTYPLVVTLDSVWNANNDHDFIAVWVDWNNDKTFAANERYTSNKFVGATKKDTVNITIPDSAVIGNVRIRVRSIWNGSNTLTQYEACGSNLWGQVEDYTFNIVAAPITQARIAPPSTKNQSTNDLKMTAFPNPTTGIIDINYSNANSNVTLDVIDFTGKTVLSKTFSEGNKQLDLSGFAKGIYFIRAREIGVAALKIIVQ
jgi:Pregnancy-associated plasma protein-A/GEVED domain/Secretion system C-terminal sorting domain